ncbi:hypothetical protein V8D89_004309 [Ganoderma adspersum]
MGSSCEHTAASLGCPKSLVPNECGRSQSNGAPHQDPGFSAGRISFLATRGPNGTAETAPTGSSQCFLAGREERRWAQARSTELIEQICAVRYDLLEVSYNSYKMHGSQCDCRGLWSFRRHHFEPRSPLPAAAVPPRSTQSTNSGFTMGRPGHWLQCSWTLKVYSPSTKKGIRLGVSKFHHFAPWYAPPPRAGLPGQLTMHKVFFVSSGKRQRP